MFDAPEDSNFKLVTFGNFQRQLRYNSPDCPVYTGHVRCSKEERPPELASLGNSFQQLRYNSPDCPVYTGLSGVTAGQRLLLAPTATCVALNARQRAEVRHAHAGAPDTQQYMSGAPPDIQAGPEVRAPMVGTQRPWWRGCRTGHVRCAPDCPVRHRTDSLTKRLVWWLGL
jgi:hypothetical protein